MFEVLIGKPVAFYVAIVGAALFVYENNHDRPLASRLMVTLSSAMLGYSVGPAAAVYAGLPEILATAVITAVGFIFLEIGSALIKDREMFKDLILRRRGDKK